MDIFVAKLSPNTNEEDLRNMFEQYGTVDTVKIIMDRDTGRSKGFGFIEMQDDDAAYRAINDLSDSIVDGRSIVVKRAEPRTNNRNMNHSRGGGHFNRGGGRDDYSRGGGGSNHNRY